MHMNQRRNQLVTNKVIQSFQTSAANTLSFQNVTCTNLQIPMPIQEPTNENKEFPSSHPRGECHH